MTGERSPVGRGIPFRPTGRVGYSRGPGGRVLSRSVANPVVALGLLAMAVTGCVGPGGADPRDDESARAARLDALGEELLARGQVEAAIEAYQAALVHEPRSYRTHYRLAQCYYHLGDYALEMAEYRLCLAINPRYRPALLNLGHAATAVDDLDTARWAYYAYLDLSARDRARLDSPADRSVLYNLAMVERDLGNADEAEALLARFRALEAVGK